MDPLHLRNLHVHEFDKDSLAEGDDEQLSQGASKLPGMA